MAVGEEDASALARQLRRALADRGWERLLADGEAEDTPDEDGEGDTTPKPRSAVDRLEALVDRLAFVVADVPAMEQRVREQLDDLEHGAGPIKAVILVAPDGSTVSVGRRDDPSLRPTALIDLLERVRVALREGDA